MGQILAQILRTRKLDTFSARRKGKGDDRALAVALRDASLDERSELEALLRGFGFDLAHCTDFNTEGVPPGGHLFLAVRRLDESRELFSERWIDEAMQLRNDSVTERRIWFTQLWFVLFSLFYTRRDRVTTEVSRYVETNFTKADLAGAMRDYINDMVRKIGQESLADDAVYRCLTSESGMQIEQYTERFLGLMVSGGLLDSIGENRYRQSLLSATEIKLNAVQGLEPWLMKAAASVNPLELGRELLVRDEDREDSEES